MRAAHILIADPTPEVAERERDFLEREYGDAYDVTVVDTAASALSQLQEWKAAGERTAMLVIDESLNSSTHPSCLESANTRAQPFRVIVSSDLSHIDSARERVYGLLANDAVLNSRPPDQEFSRVTAELLNDWMDHDDPALQRVVIVGPRWSPRTHDLKEFLTMSHVPFAWADSSDPAMAERYRGLLQTGAGPVVITPDGKELMAPSIKELAASLDLSHAPHRPVYDVIIVGGGPAGLSAAAIAASEGRSVLVIERDAPGGQAGHSSRIENYPGFPSGIPGGALTERILLQAMRLGAEVMSPVDVAELRDCATGKAVLLADGREIYGRSIVLANGVEYRRLPATGADRLTGAGVYYGASTAETRNFADESVVIVGGANSAGQAALDLSRVAAHIDIAIRGPNIEAGMSQYLIEQIAAKPNIRVRTNTEATEVRGQDHVESVVLTDRTTHTAEAVAATGVFAFIGATPRTQWLASTDAAALEPSTTPAEASTGAAASQRISVDLDEHGFVITGDPVTAAWSGESTLTATSHPGVFAIGDVRSQATRRVSAAVGQAAEVVPQLHRFLDAQAEKIQGLTYPEALTGSVALPVQSADSARALVREAFGGHGFHLTPLGESAQPSSWWLSQPELGPRGRDMAQISLAHDAADHQTLHVEVPARALTIDPTACGVAVRSWVKNIGVFIDEQHRIDTAGITAASARAAAAPSRARTAAPGLGLGE